MLAEYVELFSADCEGLAGICSAYKADERLRLRWFHVDCSKWVIGCRERKNFLMLEVERGCASIFLDITHC